MGSEVLVGARVCAADGEAHESDADSSFPAPNIDEFNGPQSDKGTSNDSESFFWIKKADSESGRNDLLSRLAAEDVSQGIDHGTTSSSIALMSASEGKHTRKAPRNGSGSFKKLRMLQTNNLLPQAEAEDRKMESDKLGMHVVKCSYSDKSATIKQRNNANGRRGDKKKDKVQMKAKCDPFSLKAGLPSFSRTSGGSSPFGMYGLKPEIHDVTKLIDDILLDDLLDGSCKFPTQGKDKGKKAAYVNENILDLVRKACSILQLRGLQPGKQIEELDIDVNKKVSLVSSPSRTSAENASDGDESSLPKVFSKCSMDQESCIKTDAPADMNNTPLYQPKDVLERLALPPPKDLDSLLQDAVKPSTSAKLTDSRSNKILSHHASLSPFSWSNNFNGHCKSSNDAARISNKSSCVGRWVRIRSGARLIGEGGSEGCMDLDSLSYDDSLVPAGKLKYRLPDIGKTSSTFVSQDRCQHDLSSALSSTASLLPHAPQSPTVLTAARTLCDITSQCTKLNLNGRMKWPRQPSRETTKARNSRSCEKTDEDYQTSKSEKLLDHVVRGVEGGSSKKPRIAMAARLEDFSHVQTVIGQSSASALRSSRSSPSRSSRDSVAEARHCNGSFMKPSFMVAPPPRPPDRSSHNPQKMRKVGPVDWNRARR